MQCLLFYLYYLLITFNMFIQIVNITFLALISAMSSIISSCRLWVLPLLLGGPVIPVDESRRPCNILVAPAMGNAAIDSRRLRPNRVVGTLEIVTTECRRPDCGAGVCESVAKKAASLADGPDPSPPRSLNRRTCSHVNLRITLTATFNMRLPYHCEKGMIEQLQQKIC